MASAKKPGTNGSRAKLVELSKIRLDGDTQSREELDEDVIKEYADLMAEGTEFPPITVTFDGTNYWLVDGFHRRFAAVKAKASRIKCIVVTGTREDARWLSYGANKDHGLPRRPEDKQKAVVAALKHPKSAGMSDKKLAEHVGVHFNTIAKHRTKLESDGTITHCDSRTGRDGRTINTANIGSKPSTKTEDNPPTVDPMPAPEVRQYKDDFDPERLSKELAKEKKPGTAKKQWDDQRVVDAIGQFGKQIDAFYGNILSLFDECHATAGGTEADLARARRAALHGKAKSHELIDGVTTAFRTWRPKK